MTPEQAAYEAWGTESPVTLEVLPWERLPEEYALIWRKVAKAVIDQHIIDSDGDCSYDRWQKLKEGDWE